MNKTPPKYRQALELITTSKLPSNASEPEALIAHRARVRAAFDDPNIVAIGISEKESDSKGTGDLSLCFYVVEKKSTRRIPKNRLIPPVVAVNDRTPVFTDVKVIGKIAPQVQKRRSPVQNGFSVAHAKDSPGTVAAIVRKAGKLYILSNAHVLARAGRATKGDPVVYPGPADGGKVAQDTIANLSEFSPFIVGNDFQNRVDAALAEINPARVQDVSFAIHGATFPLTTTTPQRGMRVVKFGRTTGKTESVILDVNFRVLVKYPGVGPVGFLDQVLCRTYTRGGDSGALVVEKNSGKVLGLHFAGSPRGSVFTPIDFVIGELGFSFENG